MRLNRRVVCAAIRADDGSILIGIRHYSQDMHMQIDSRNDGEKFTHRGGHDQGFVDQYGTYMDRLEAFKIASEAGQIFDIDACSYTPDGIKLYSEGLY